MSMDDCHIIGWQRAQTHTHILAEVGVESIELNEEALTTRDNKGETPIDIARILLPKIAFISDICLK